MENTMVMDTSFIIRDKSAKVNLHMEKGRDKQLYGMRTEISLQASSEMISMCKEKRFIKMEFVMKVSLMQTINFMAKGNMFTKMAPDI